MQSSSRGPLGLGPSATGADSADPDTVAVELASDRPAVAASTMGDTDPPAPRSRNQAVWRATMAVRAGSAAMRSSTARPASSTQRSVVASSTVTEISWATDMSSTRTLTSGVAAARFRTACSVEKACRVDHDDRDRGHLMRVSLATMAGVEQPRPAELGGHLDRGFPSTSSRWAKRVAPAVAAFRRRTWAAARRTHVCAMLQSQPRQRRTAVANTVAGSSTTSIVAESLLGSTPINALAMTSSPSPVLVG